MQPKQDTSLKSNTQKSKQFVSYEIVSEKNANNTTYKLVKNRLLEVSREKRKKILESIMDKEHAFGLIEWWSKGSIVSKPRKEFYIILLCSNEED